MVARLNPSQLRLVRQAVVEMLRKNPPPVDSYAIDEYRLQLRVQEAELNGGLLTDMEVLQQVWDYSLHHEVEDEMVLSYLERLPERRVGRWANLPRGLRKVFFNQGIPALGLKPGVRAALAGVTVLLLGLTFSGYQWRNWTRYDQDWYYFDSDADRMRFYNYVGVDHLQDNRYQAAERNLRQAQLWRDRIGASTYLAPDYNLAYLAWRQQSQGNELQAREALAQLSEEAEESLGQGDLSSKAQRDLAQIRSRAEYGLGVLYLQRNDTEAALISFREAAKGDSVDWSGRYGEALALVQKSWQGPKTEKDQKLALAVDRFQEVAASDQSFLARQQGLVQALDSLTQVAPDPVMRTRYQQLLAVARGQAPPQMTAETLQGEIPPMPIDEFRAKDVRLVTDFVEGLAVVEYQGKYGYLDRNDNLVGGIRYEDARPFSEGLAAVKRDGRWGYVNRQQEGVIGFRFQRAQAFRDGWAAVKGSEGNWGVIDQTGRVQLDFIYDKPVTFEREAAVPPGEEALAAAYIAREPRGKYRYINKQGESVFGDKLFQLAENFEGSYARVQRYGEVYYIDRSGDCVSERLAGGSCPQEKWDYVLLRARREHRAGITRVAFSGDGQTLATASTDSTVRVWGADGSRLRQVLTHGDWVRALALGEQGKTVYTGTRSGRVVRWDRAGKVSATNRFDQREVWALALDPRGQLLAVGLEDGTIEWLDSRNLESLGKLRLPTALRVGTLAFSPDGEYLIAGTADGVLRIWRTAGGNVREIAVRDAIQAVAFSSDGRRVAAGTRGGLVKVYRFRDGQLQHSYRAHSDWVNTLAFAPGRSPYYLLSAGQDRSLRVYDLTREQAVLTLRLKPTITAAAFDPSGKKLVVGTRGPSRRGLDQVLLFLLDRY